MKLEAWRLVSPWLGLRKAGFMPAPTGGRWHKPGDFVIYAWESSELAAMALTHLAGAFSPQVMLLERLRLPDNADLFRTANIGQPLGATPPLSEETNLPEQMNKSDLLGIWVPSTLYPQQQVLVLNPLHKSFPRVSITSSRLVTRADAL